MEDRATAPDSLGHAGGRVGAAANRGKRERMAVSYDETTRRARGPKRARHVAYMDRGGRRRAGQKRTAIEMCVVAVHRVVAGTYEWRDAGLPTVGDHDGA